jgi:HAD superfamily hydrolase (TIGR01509 family)
MLSPGRPTAAVLDMDGLLIDTEPAYRYAFQAAGRDLGFEISDEIYASLIGRSNAESEAIVSRRFGAAFPIDEFRRRWPAIWRERVAGGIVAKPGVIELLSLLDERSVPIALATSSDREFTTFSLEAAGLADRLPLRVTGDEIARGKPMPDIYLEAARRLGVRAVACMAFEDSEAGVRSAASAGMRVVMVPDLRTPSPAIAALAAVVLPSLYDALPVVSRWLDGGDEGRNR